MKKKILRNMGPWLGLLLFMVALWVLHKELKAYHYQDILRSIEALPAHRLYVGLGLTLLNYLIMSSYDIFRSFLSFAIRN